MIHQATSEIRWHQNRDKTETDKYSVPFSKLYVGGGGWGTSIKGNNFSSQKERKKKRNNKLVNLYLWSWIKKLFFLLHISKFQDFLIIDVQKIISAQQKESYTQRFTHERLQKEHCRRKRSKHWKSRRTRNPEPKKKNKIQCGGFPTLHRRNISRQKKAEARRIAQLPYTGGDTGPGLDEGKISNSSATRGRRRRKRKKSSYLFIFKRLKTEGRVGSGNGWGWGFSPRDLSLLINIFVLYFAINWEWIKIFKK